MFVQLVFDCKQSGDKNIQKAEKSFLNFFLLPKKYTGHFEGNEINLCRAVTSLKIEMFDNFR